jgi:formylglycine-generating enzyme required for sulfatase activity
MLEKAPGKRPANAGELGTLVSGIGTKEIGGAQTPTVAIGGPVQPVAPTVKIVRGGDSGPEEESDGKRITSASHPVPGEKIRNFIGMSLAGVAEGSFFMGNPKAKTPDSFFENEDYHRVMLSHPFWIGRFPVSWKEYSLIMDAKTPQGAGEYPVTGISWEEADRFCRLLQENESRNHCLPVGYTYCLPTEAQWEYCCRAGTSGEFSTGKNLERKQANFDGSGVTPVGVYPANNWGLYDMHGQVWEYCRDAFREHLGNSPQSDPFSPEPTTTIVCRGGSWRSRFARDCRASSRAPQPRNNGAWDIGFRVALVAIVSK